MEKLGRYDIIGVLGKGAMGMVYEARDPNLDRKVAIKTIKVDNLSPEATVEYEARFRTEARSAARLQHPNIVSVYDSERHGDVAYLVMEFVRGEDLKHHLDSGTRYTLEQSLGIVGDLLAALDYAHRQNIVHRDVKPANLLVEASGRVKLTDFGVARIQDSGEATRTKGSMVGTLKYMSPEQVQGKPIDARADLFAAGVVLYQLLTGKRPFDGDSEFAIIHQIISDDPVPPSVVNDQLPPAIDAVVARALAKDRGQRYASAQEFSQALHQAAAQVLDRTIVPPAMPADRTGLLGTGSGAQRSRTGGSTVRLAVTGEDSGSTVTQELELVYWKDVKDSDDTEDLQGFLDRFPQGVYAELAARRLKKLRAMARGEASGTGSTMTGVTPFSVKYNDATMLQQAAPQPEAGAAAGDLASTLGKGGGQTPGAAAPAAAIAPAAEPRRSPGPKFAVIALLVAAFAGLGYKMLPTSTPAGVPATVSDRPLDKPAVAPVAKPEVGVAKEAAATPTAPASAAAAAIAVTKTAAKPAAPGVDKSKAAKPVEPAPAPAPAAVSAAATPVPAPVVKPPANVAPSKQSAAEAPGMAALPGNPQQACEGRVLLGYQICLGEQCAKPAFANHPVCVERRAIEQQRRATQGTDR